MDFVGMVVDMNIADMNSAGTDSVDCSVGTGFVDMDSVGQAADTGSVGMDSVGQPVDIYPAGMDFVGTAVHSAAESAPGSDTAEIADDPGNFGVPVDSPARVAAVPG